MLVSDNASQYRSSLFKTFARDWGFIHETISPGNSQANGAAEGAVKVAKRILRKSHSSGEDPYIALLNLRNTPTEGLNTSPAQRLFGRRTKSMIPTSEARMRPGYADTSQETALKEKRRTQSTPTNLRDLQRLDVGDTVRMQPIRTGEREWKEATVKKAITSRAFDVETADGRHYRRNRRHLRASTKSSHSLPPQRGHNHLGFRETRQGQTPEVPTPQNGDTTALNNDDTGTTADVPTSAPLTSRYGRHI